FPGGTNIEKLLHHQMDKPTPVEQLRPDLPPQVRSILQQMLAKRPEDRIQTAGEEASLLAPYADGGVAAVPASSTRTLRLPAGGAAGLRAGPGSLTMKLSSTFGSIRGLFVDPASHRTRRLALVIALVALIGLLGMFVVVLSLVSGLAASPGKPTS